MVTFAVEALDDVSVALGSPLDGMDLMSPFVWAEDGRYRMMLRAVPRPLRDSDPTGVIACASSDDGLAFAIDGKLAIAPGGAPDAADDGGCEDPTVVPREGGGYLVFYTGVDGRREQGALLAAAGPSVDALAKQAVMLKAPAGEGNIKEATVVRAASGGWRLFYEYAADQASRIGLAVADDLAGPWTPIADPFTIRPDGWDNWHLSTGPICIPDGGDPVMFYNGATIDARWRIGWVSFDPDFTRVTGRGLEPVLMPPPVEDRSATDIAFAASTVIEDGIISLYYSLEDRILRRARIRYYA